VRGARAVTTKDASESGRVRKLGREAGAGGLTPTPAQGIAGQRRGAPAALQALTDSCARISSMSQ
jgi:hypothetical protein